MAEYTVAFPIDALVRLVAEALDLAGVEQTNGQVSAAPTERTLRYYRTRGLLDPPAGHRGRIALYARRHVLQVLAIKRLQAADVPLHDIQQRLVGRSDAELAAIAGVDPSTVAARVATAARPPEAGERPDAPPGVAARRFWADRPTTTTASGTTEPSPVPIAGLQLDGGVRLTFPAARELTAADRAALTAAMAGVVARLRERQLLHDQLDTERTTP